MEFFSWYVAFFERYSVAFYALAVGLVLVPTFVNLVLLLLKKRIYRLREEEFKRQIEAARAVAKAPDATAEMTLDIGPPWGSKELQTVINVTASASTIAREFLGNVSSASERTITFTKDPDGRNEKIEKKAGDKK